MKKLTNNQTSELLFAFVCFLLSVILLYVHTYVIDVNPNDTEFIGSVKFGALGFLITSLVFFIRALSSIARSNE